MQLWEPPSYVNRDTLTKSESDKYNCMMYEPAILKPINKQVILKKT